MRFGILCFEILELKLNLGRKSFCRPLNLFNARTCLGGGGGSNAVGANSRLVSTDAAFWEQPPEQELVRNVA